MKEHDYLEKGWAESNPPKTYTDAVWRFDDRHLVIRSSYEVMDAWARMGDSDTRGRFGYYEYSLVELTDVPEITSLFKLDYHDTAYKDWGLGNLTSFVYPESLSLNPTQSKLVFSLTPRSVFCPFLLCSSLLILDYSETPIQKILVPLTYNPVWSPDGNHLAYLHTKCTKQFKDCVANLEIMSMRDGSREIIPNWEYNLSAGWDSSALASFAWLDNQNFFYRVFPPQRSGDYDLWTFTSYSLVAKSTTDIPSDKIQNYAVFGKKVGLYYMFEEAVGFSGGIIPITLENGQRKFVSNLYVNYNSRFPNRMLLDSFVVFESGNKQTLIDLSAIIPKDEWIAAIAP